MPPWNCHAAHLMALACPCKILLEVRRSVFTTMVFTMHPGSFVSRVWSGRHKPPRDTRRGSFHLVPGRRREYAAQGDELESTTAPRRRGRDGRGGIAPTRRRRRRRRRRLLLRTRTTPDCDDEDHPPGCDARRRPTTTTSGGYGAVPPALLSSGRRRRWWRRRRRRWRRRRRVRRWRRPRGG